MTFSPQNTAVVVPAYNRALTLGDTLASVSHQTVLPHQVVIIDDGSTDETAHIARQWALVNPKLCVTIKQTRQQGAAQAKNVGLSLCQESTVFIAFLDSDDYWPKDFLERASNALQREPKAIAASTDRLQLDSENTTLTLKSLRELPVCPWTWILAHGAGIGSCTLFRAAAIRQIGGYPESFPTGHDAVLFGRVAHLGLWLHLPGDPTQMLIMQGQSEQALRWHLYTHHPDFQIVRAKAGQLVWDEAPTEVRERSAGAKQGLAKRWVRAVANALRLKHYHLVFYTLYRLSQASPIGRQWKQHLIDIRAML